MQSPKLKVWLDGKIIPYPKARVPILTHSLQYGSGVFEGIRAYEAEDGPVIFRLQDHMKRFLSSMKIYFIEQKYSQKQLEKAVIDVVKANKLSSCYIRPFAFYNTDEIGVGAYGKPVSIFIAAIPLGAYYGKGKDQGIRCKVSSWRRINSDILPVEAKGSGNYLNSIMANYEAKDSGFEEAILLSASEGYVAEGTAENIFLVEKNALVTPDKGSDILLGVTRDSVMEIADDLGIGIDERQVHKEELYSADEVFFTGTAAEITPVVNIDGIKVGNGKPGAITKKIAKKFDDVVHGRDHEYRNWLTYVK